MMKKWKGMGNSCGGPGVVYGLGFIGVAIYYLQHASTFLEGLIGVLKALVWPALLTFKLFQFFKM